MRSFRVHLLRLALVVVALGAPGGSSAAAAPERQGSPPYVIDSFDVDIDLHTDASMRVRETIAVTFNEPRHGIYRRIPIEYDTGRGTARRLFLDVASVTDEQGDELTTDVSRDSGDVVIRVGDADIELAPGTQQTYVITYDAKGMLNWQPGGDAEPYTELYWNATGDQWDTTIGRSSVTIHYPEAAAVDDVRLLTFAGEYGSRDSDGLNGAGAVEGPVTETRLEVRPGVATVTREAPFSPFQGLTAVLALPEGVIPEPGPVERLWAGLVPNLGFFLPLVALAMMAGAWLWRGRDPAGGPVVVQYDAPEGITGPESGALLDERVDNRDVAAGFVRLATLGYLTFHARTEKGLLSTHRKTDVKLTGKEPDAELTPFDQRLLELLGDAGDKITEDELRTKVAPHVGELNQRLYDSLVSRGYYKHSPVTTKVLWFVAGVAVLVGAGLVVTLLAPLHNPLPAIIGGALGAGIVWIASRAMSARTHAGAKAFKAVQGLEEFIRRAKSAEFRAVLEADPNGALFERLLAHAVAFGLVAEWATAFEGLLKAPPGWYVTSDGGVFAPHVFGSDLNATTQAVGAAAATPPRSSGAAGGHSGFGGGGFSGGGFGGGGGGSW